jgi:50S ribosomal protein L16 3-hydroxylase
MIAMRYDERMKKNSHHQQQKTLLGGISPKQFLKQYWQKKPLLIRQAIPGFNGLLDGNELAGLACEEDVQSRLVSYVRKQWLVEEGPFDESRFASLGKKHWTLLVQGVNHHLPEAAELLQRFNFIPHARLDDLMVSFAPDGGGVGPHFDSYDVFLLQGQGKRLWRISQQKDLSLIENAPLKILQNFDTAQEYLLEPGDMLYLPPHVAHWGIAAGDCMTYSIGFRAPSAQELATEFLAHLQENIALQGMYADASLGLQKHPAEISEDMVMRVNAMLKKIRWNKQTVGEFLGIYLSEPKPHIVFEPRSKGSLERFRKAMSAKGLSLDLKTQALFFGDLFFINGEHVTMAPDWKGCLRQLADLRGLPPGAVGEVLLQDADLMQLFFNWYLAGYLHTGQSMGSGG